MYQLVMGIQVVSIIAVFAECWVVFKNWKGVLHSWLFLSCVATLANNTGYFFQLMARTEEAYFTALRLSYLGRVWVAFALFMFIMELVRYKIPQIAKILFALINAVTYVIVITTQRTGLYYRNVKFRMNGQFPDFGHVNGIWHHFWNITLIQNSKLL